MFGFPYLSSEFNEDLGLLNQMSFDSGCKKDICIEEAI
jgi:hypothetical protein